MKQNIFYLYPIFFLQKPLLSDVLPTIFLHINVHIACWKFYPLVETYQSSLKSCPIVFHMFCVSVKVLTKGRRDDYPLSSQTFLFVYHRSRQWKSFVSWGAIVNRRYYFVRKLFPVSMNFSIEAEIVIHERYQIYYAGLFTVCLSVWGTMFVVKTQIQLYIISYVYYHYNHVNIGEDVFWTYIVKSEGLSDRSLWKSL